MRLRLLAIVFVVVMVGATTASAGTVWIVRDGFYVGSEDNFSELTYFHVSHRRVYHLRFVLNLSCHNNASGEDYPRTFDAGSRMPQGEMIPTDGMLTLSWTQSGGGRLGSITAELRFHRHPMASFWVTADGGNEDCTGFAAIRIQRSRITPPLPPNP